MVGEINNWIDNNDSQKELCKILDGTGYFQQKKSGDGWTNLTTFKDTLAA